MKRSAITCSLLASLVSAALVPSTAAAQGVGQVYWGLFTAAQFIEDNKIDGDKLEFDPGFALGGQLGYIFGTVRAEGELEYSNTNVDQLGGNSNNADLSTFRGTGNLYFDFVGFAQSNILPYVGGGVGFASLDFDGNDLNDDDTALTAHGEFGISFAASTNFDVVVSYRYEWFDTDVGDVKDDITIHQIRAGMRFF